MTPEKTSGIKLHIGVDTNGLPHAMWVTTADETDRIGALEMCSHEFSYLTKVKKLLVDSGYSGADFAEAIESLLDAEVEVVKRSELRTFKVMPRRWVVERTFGWLDKCRELWKNCERKLHNSLQMAKIAFICIILKNSKQTLRNASK